MRKKGIKILKLAVPIVLLSIIFFKIDIEQLGAVFANSNKQLLLIVFISFPLRYLIFTFRWKIILNKFGNNRIPFFRLLKIIYMGLFVGYFVPTSLGVDIYRVIKLKKNNISHINIGLIFQEKIMGLVVCALLVLFFSEFIDVNMGDIYPYMKNILYVSITSALVALVVLLLTRESTKAQFILNLAERKLTVLLKHFSFKFNKEVKLEDGFMKKVLKISLSPKLILIVILFSVINQCIGAVFANIAFQSFGININILFNLFANPLLNIIFLFPISFGSLGIREGAYILIFGILGINAEISLLVSFVLLVSILINIGIGGILYIQDKKK